MSGRAITAESGTATASIGGRTLASATAWQRCEGNVYFPPSSVSRDLFRPTELLTYCPWKGHASYYSAEVDGNKTEDAAWCYEDPFDAAKVIKDHFAFDRSKVTINVQ